MSAIATPSFSFKLGHYRANNRLLSLKFDSEMDRILSSSLSFKVWILEMEQTLLFRFIHSSDVDFGLGKNSSLPLYSQFRFGFWKWNRLFSSDLFTVQMWISDWKKLFSSALFTAQTPPTVHISKWN